MASVEHRFGLCSVIASARLRGPQETAVQGIAAVASPTKTPHLAVRVGGVLLYLEDRAALDSVVSAVQGAALLADRVFGPAAEGFAALGVDHLEEARRRRARRPCRHLLR